MSIKHKKLFTCNLIIILFFIVTSFLWGFQIIAADESSALTPDAYELQVPIFDYSKSQNIAEYITKIYQYTMLVLIPLLIIIIIIGGVSWIAAAGDTGKIKAAKDRIISGFIGLFIALFSYIMLDLIGINVLNVPTLESIKPLEGIELMDFNWAQEAGASAGGTPQSGSATSVGCPSDSQLQRISSSGSLIVEASDPRLLPQVAAKLTEAANKAGAQGCKLKIVSGFRSLEKQTSLWNKALAKYGSESAARRWVAKPSCGAPHMTGGAVDAGLICGSQSCIPINNCPATSLKSKLEQIMFSAGWARYSGEWWHFEYGTNRWKKCSGGAC